MAEAQAVTAAKNSSQLGLVRLAGRIEVTRSKSGQNGRLFFTLLRLPAADKYASAATVEVISTERLGADQDEVSIVCRVGGYARNVTPNDPQASKYRTADNVLSFVEFA